MDSDLVLVIVVVTALAFDFTNGFHDTANVVATGISTRAIPPRTRRPGRRAAQLRGRLHLARGGGDGREWHRAGGPDHSHDRVRRPDRRDRVEPDHLVVRPAVELVARADRRRGGCGAGGRRHEGAGQRRAGRARSSSRRWSRRCSRSSWRRFDPVRLLDHRAAAARVREPGLPARADRVRGAAGARRTAPTTHRRRWGSSPSP